MRTPILIAAICGVACSSKPDFGYPLDDVLRLNHAQLKGTHNSYHQRPDNVLANDWDYSHAPLADQLEKQGVRQLELDVHWIPSEGIFKVFHLPGVDEKSSCPVFTDCLAQVRGWSDAHPGHFPIFVFIEPKDDLDGNLAKIPPVFDVLDEAVRAAWPEDRLITPDRIRGKHATLSEAITTDGWPTFGELRGSVLFILLDKDREPGLPLYEYTHGLKDLEGRAMFATGTADDPFAAILSLEDSHGDAEATTAAAKKGFIIRTLVDDGHGDAIESTADRDAALAGSAHIVSSDYPVAGLAPDYDVELKGGTPARCHPVTAPAGCTSEAIESAGRMTAHR